jgi:hypothetical protein
MREKMADEGLTSFIVSYDYEDEDAPIDEDAAENAYSEQYWAEDKPHAAEQFKDSNGDGVRIVAIETQDHYETRTGEELDYGNRENV